MADLQRIAPHDLTPGSIENVEDGFKNDDADIKNIYTLVNKLRNWYKGTVAPSSPNPGDKWEDSSTTPSVLKEWNGSAWVALDWYVALTEVVTVATANKLLKLDVNAEFPANAISATKLKTARNINGVSFDGSTDILITKIGAKDIATTDQISNFDTAHSFVQNGYQKLANGLIIQWGSFSGTTQVTFPIAFPNNCFNVQYTCVSSIDGGTGYEYIKSNTVTKTGFNTVLNPLTLGYWYAIGI